MDADFGSCMLIYMYPWSSSGRKLVGRWLLKNHAATPATTSSTITTAALRMSSPDQRTKLSVERSKYALNQPKNFPSGPRVCFLGLRSSAESAGLNVRALNADSITEIAIVIANC